MMTNKKLKEAFHKTTKPLEKTSGSEVALSEGLKSLGENLEKLYWDARHEGKMLAMEDNLEKAEKAFKIQDKIMEALDIYEKAF